MKDKEHYNAPIKFGLINYIVYYTVRSLGWLIVNVLWRTKVNGLENLRNLKGPAIIAPTHRSALDPVAIGLQTRRPLRPLAKAEIVDYKLGWIFIKMGAQPLRRGEADREALRIANEWLNAGELVLIFPEGTRKEGPTVQELHAGVGYLAAKHNVPVIPVGIGGTEDAMPKGAKFVHRANVRVEIGEPILPNPDLKLREASAAVMEELGPKLQKLYDDARSAKA